MMGTNPINYGALRNLNISIYLIFNWYS